jgi:hypothetical protein
VGGDILIVEQPMVFVGTFIFDHPVVEQPRVWVGTFICDHPVVEQPCLGLIEYSV